MQIGPKAIVILALVLASSGLAALAFWPDLDLAVSAWFSGASGHFEAATPQAHFFRGFAAFLPFIIFFGVTLFYMAGLVGAVPRHRAMSHRAMIFLALSLALGPGLLVNKVFKSHFHRPRPVHVQEFGGESPFRPFYRLDGECPKNCSFPSGEASAAFWIAAPAALLPPPLNLPAMAAAILFGLITGGFRMAAGAHFLSDVLFAGIVTALIAMALWAVLARPKRQDAKAGTGLHGDLAPL